METELMTVDTPKPTKHSAEDDIPAARRMLPDWGLISDLVDTENGEEGDKKSRPPGLKDYANHVVSYLELYNEVRRTELLLRCWRARADLALYRGEIVQTRLKWGCSPDNDRCPFHSLVWPEYRLADEEERPVSTTTTTPERPEDEEDPAEVRMVESFARSVQIFFYCFTTKDRYARQKAAVLRLRNWLEGLAVPELRRVARLGDDFPDDLVVEVLRRAYPCDRFGGGAALDVHGPGGHGMRILERAYRKKLYLELRRLNDNVGMVLSVVKSSWVVNILMKIVEMRTDFSKVTGML